MNEKINQTLIEILNTSKNVSLDIYNFLQEQSPLLVEEIIKWGIWENGIKFAISFLFVVLSWSFIVFTVVGFYKNKGELYWDKKREDIKVLGGIFLIASILLFLLSVLATFITCIPSLFSMVRAIVAPRIFILEYVKDLVA